MLKSYSEFTPFIIPESIPIGSVTNIDSKGVWKSYSMWTVQNDQIWLHIRYHLSSSTHAFIQLPKNKDKQSHSEVITAVMTHLVTFNQPLVIWICSCHTSRYGLNKITMILGCTRSSFSITYLDLWIDITGNVIDVWHIMQRLIQLELKTLKNDMKCMPHQTKAIEEKK